MPSRASFLLLLTLWASMEDGLSLPSAKPLERGSAGGAVSPQRERTKRCACSNRLDSECHYFCHLDIIWVNTASKTTLYGLASPLARRRRSTGRCICADPVDRTCAGICVNRSFKIHSSKRTMKRAQTKLPGVLRGLADVRDKVVDAVNPEKEKAFDARGKNAR